MPETVNHDTAPRDTGSKGTGPYALLAGGGTGGHVFPALAVGAELVSRGWRVGLAGRSGGMEERLAARRGVEFHALAARPLVGQSAARRALAVATLVGSAVRGWALVRRLAARVVFGTGGYVCAPAVLGARLAGRPAVLLEPNARAGAANRWLSRAVAEAVVAYAETVGDLRCPAVHTGVPVRAEFLQVPAELPAGAGRVLVLGGSQGARQLNELVPVALARLAAEGVRVAVVHQAGRRHTESTREAYRRHAPGAEVEVTPFLDDVAGAMARCRLVISRAGAVTLAEICAAGRPALLVPLALAGGHQAHNAAALEAAGGARLLPATELGADELATALGRLLADRPRLEAMAAAARALARPGAAGAIADRLEALGAPGSTAAAGGEGLMFWRFTGLSRLHFVGIGGAGMSGIAEVLLDYDLEVSGCDLAESETTRRLERLGAPVAKGHSPDHLEGVDLLVISSAVSRDNPEVVAARERGIPVVRRAEMLGELMRLKYGIAVAGTHGKTTTTSLVGTLLTEAGLDPTVIVGGRLRVSGTGARLGRSDYLVVEADEFDRSFLRLQPIVAVVTTVDRDHLDTYPDLDALRDAFVDFATRVPFFGQLIVCLDDPGIQEILPRLEERRVVTYGVSPQADLVAVGIETREEKTHFEVRSAEGGLLGAIELPLPGVHNVRNALAAVAVGLAMELELATIARALTAFTGVHRRFERIGSWRGATVVDDYAHHPTEVAATLEAAHQAFPRARIHAVFQPHLYSRTRDHADAFGRSLLDADTALVTDIYPSREEPIAGVDAAQVVTAARASGHRHVELCRDWREAPAALADEVGEGDVVITLGAGDIYRLAGELAATPGGGGGE